MTIGLNEKQKTFRVLSSLDDVKMALHLSPDSKLPLLVAAGGQKISGWKEILKFIGYDLNDEDYSEILLGVNRLALASSMHAEKMVELIRYPFHTKERRQAFVEAKIELVAHLGLNPKTQELQKSAQSEIDYCSVSENVETSVSEIGRFLESIEKRLADENHLGPWLSGIQFSAADCVISGVLMLLFQIGQDYQWREGALPNLSIYEVQAFQRPSIIPLWKGYEREKEAFDQESTDIKNARYACYLALGLAGVYTVKKVFFNSK